MISSGISFYTQHLEEFDELTKTSELINKAFYDTVERFVVKAITEIEGHAPIVEDVKRFGSRNVFPGGKQVITYRDIPILEIPPDAMKFQDGRLVVEIRVNKIAMLETNSK